jgi:hypothetical protein
VQTFWSLSGLRDEVSEHYLRNQRSELEWIRDAIAVWNVPGIHETSHGPQSRTLSPSIRLDLVVSHWVDYQISFFKEAEVRDQGRLLQRTGWIQWLFYSGLAIALVVLILEIKFGNTHCTYKPYRRLLFVLMGILPAVAAAVGGYMEKMAFAAQARRYQWMMSFFSNAKVELERVIGKGQSVEAQEILRELGKEALQENGDWVRAHRDRTVEIPW